MMSKKNNFHITFLSTWPKTPDGIATFCENLVSNLPLKIKNKKVYWDILKVNRFKQIAKKNKNKIISELNYNKKIDYCDAAKKINHSDCDVVIIQFINGIYGGRFGEYIFNFIDNLKKPLLVILHSVAMLPNQSNVIEKQKILKEFLLRNNKVVVMSKTAESFLTESLKFRSKNVFMLYHGAPKFNKIGKKEKFMIRKRLGFNIADKIIFIYGILRKDKGIEDILLALKILSQKNKNIKLLLIGTDQENNKYTNKIKHLIKELNLGNFVKFIPKFITDNQIGTYLQISDIFISAQTNLGLHSSGTLSYALSAGSVILSTPIIHAKELLSNKEYSLIPINDSKAIAKSVLEIINNKKLFLQIKKDNMVIGKKILWKNISKKYLEIAYEVANENSSCR